ncbi:hypothetical protein QFC21_003789 [Naganishia friedmannii]|uniref:Uncharacterized protein n=1 Tax=Naganishia friedmannii TaxID=89922 RepID=A0ACC2VME4_9TREE|nr:hypothetical protein QFC21_003789 [Naganishia friedmannii]
MPHRPGHGSLRGQIGHLRDKLEDVAISVYTTYNSRHRHDEAHEQELDAKLEAIRDQHRFRSFAPVRPGNVVKFHIDGKDYFWAMSEAIDAATESIFIMDWWLSPELYLRRPPMEHEEWRLDRLLQRKAEEGVKIYVCVYKEVSASMTLNSRYTKHALEDLHDNIVVMRHPQHATGELIYYWSHHEKLCLVDNKLACMGGLDACYGRWDTHNHPLADVHPTEFKETLFPGQDYNNSRMMDFQTVDKFTSNALAIQDAARMPWHDVSLTMMGPSVFDLSVSFAERWNFIKEFKYRHNPHYEYLALPAPYGTVSAEARRNEAERHIQRAIEHPRLAQYEEKGRQFFHPFHHPPSTLPRADESVPTGSCRVQVLRSASDWSHGILTEDSIQQAYIQLIREANHSVYIENQFFITSTARERPVANQIGAALVERIISAARDGREFRVIIVIPAVPAFAGDIEGAAGIKAIMEAQYRSINRGGESIMEMVRKAGYPPEQYISFYNLRSYDRINSPQVAMARIWIGKDADSHHHETVTLERPKDETGDPNQSGEKQKVKEGVKIPNTVKEAVEIVRRFQAGAEGSDANVADNVGQHSFEMDSSLVDEQWNGSDEEELESYVSELCYIHSKFMCVDDRRIICGSANLNDRSQRGDRDSEIAVCIEDDELIPSTMNGKPYMAGKVTSAWRRKLMREHLGLMPPQMADNANDPTLAMHPVPSPIDYDWGSKEDQMVEDMLSPEFWRLWSQTAMRNRAIFERIFRPIPNNDIRVWEDYSTYLQPSKGILAGHVADKTLSLKEVKEMLSQVKGRLVDMPLDFLIDVKEMTTGDITSV